MASLIPSIPPADGSRPGLLTHLAQVIGGVKTFAAAVVFSISVQVGLLFNTNGTGASDIVIKAGTSQADGAVNASAKLVSLRTGIGGTEVEKAFIDKSGNATLFGSLVVNNYPNGAISCSGSWLQLGVLPVRSDSYFYSTQPSTAFYSTAGGAFSAQNTVRIWNEQSGGGASDIGIKAGFFIADGSVNGSAKILSLRTGLGGTEVEKAFVDKAFGLVVSDCVEVGGSSGTVYRDSNVVFTMNTVSKTWLFNAYDGGAHRSSLTRGGRSALGGVIATEAQGSSHRVVSVAGTNEPVLRVLQRSTFTEPVQEWWTNVDTTPLKVRQFQPTGREDAYGTDSSGTPGNVTINRPIGVSAIAAGASTVTITNSLVTANSHIVISPKNRDATCKELIWSAAAGSFTVSGTANATAALAFSWEVKGLI